MSPVPNSDDVELEALLRALEDDVESFGYPCDRIHHLDGVGLPKALNDLREFIMGKERNLTFLTPYQSIFTVFKRPVFVKTYQRWREHCVVTRRGIVTIKRTGN